MRGAEKEAELVNLVPGMSPKDFYGTVAKELIDLLKIENFGGGLRRRSFAGKEGKYEAYWDPCIRDYHINNEKKLRAGKSDGAPLTKKQGVEYAKEEHLGRGLLADWLLPLRKKSGGPLIERDFVKKNTMTKVYGAEERGAMVDQNYKNEFMQELMYAEMAALSNSDPHAELKRRLISRKYWERGRLLAKCVDEIIKKLMPRADETMKKFQKLARVLAETGGPHQFVAGTTPTGFPFLNCYRKPDMRKGIRFSIFGRANPVQKKRTGGVAWRQDCWREKRKDRHSG